MKPEKNMAKFIQVVSNTTNPWRTQHIPWKVGKMSFLSIAGIAWPIDPQVWTELPTESGGCAISRGPEIEPGNRLPWWPRKWWIFKWFEVPFFVRESYFEMGGSSTNNRLFALRQVLAIQTEKSLEMDGFQFEKDRELCVLFEESPCWWNGLKKMLSGP